MPERTIIETEMLLLDAVTPYWKKDDIVFWTALANLSERAKEVLSLRESK